MAGRLIDVLWIGRRHFRVAASVVLGMSTVVFLYGVFIYFFPAEVAVVPDSITSTEPASSTPQFRLASSTPSRIVIPKLNIDTTFEILGLNADRTIQIPKEYTTVGWYKYGPTPGDMGPAVVLGHVDSYKGAAIFYHLGQLAQGDRFTVTREDGSVAEFEVTKLERHPQSDFPTEEVYGPIDHSGIRLVTCSGTYDKGTLRYSHNLIVFGTLVSPTELPDRESAE
jgi:sortase (surface protein transpeptidase)